MTSFSAITAASEPAVDAAQLIAQLNDHAIIALDPSGNILSWNAGAERLKGYGVDEAIGMNFSVFYPAADRESGLPLTLLAQARENGSVKHSGWRVRRDGTQFWGDVVITALHADDGHVTGYAKVTRDLTSQHDLEMSLRRSEERFRNLVEQVSDYAIIALDASGTIESWNAGAERVKHYTRDEIIGRHFSMFYTPEDREAGLPLELLGEARSSGQVEHTGWRVRRGGSQFWGNVVITALHDDQGRVAGFAKVTRDLTARKRFDDAREAFFNSFTHDFRAPVSAILGYAEMLVEAEPGQARQIVAKIVSNSHRLADMTTDLIDHTRLTVNAPTRSEPVQLDDVVRTSLEGLAVDVDAARVQVAVPPLVVHTDRSSLERILVNLISNALAYSPDGTPVVVAATPRGDRIRLAVSDRGRGIDPRDLGAIFDEFQRGRLSEVDGGVGLGLASVKRLVRRIGGTVAIESELGRGTTLTLELPGVVESDSSAAAT